MFDKIVYKKFQDSSVIMMPTVSGPPPKLKTNISELKNFLSRAFSLQAIAGTSGCCQVGCCLCICFLKYSAQFETF